MTASEMEAKLREVFQQLRLKPAVKRHKKVHFVTVVRIGYEGIAELQKSGYSFDAIFDQMVESGLLSPDGDPKCLRQAFKREERRRLKLGESDNPNHDTKEAMPKPVQSVAQPSVVEKKPNETQKKINLGVTSETSLGRMTKNSDGTFEFDYRE